MTREALMAVLRCRACEDVMVAALWVVEKTGEAVAGSARWIRLRVIDASAATGPS